MIEVQLPDGRVLQVDAPDQTAAAAAARAFLETEKNPARSAVQPSADFNARNTVANPNAGIVDRVTDAVVRRVANLPDIQGTGPGRLIQGAAMLPMGAVQNVARTVGAPDRVGEVVQQTDNLRARQGSEGFDWWQAAGAIASPANLALARALPMATAGMSALRLGGAGALAGGAGGALTPVSNAENFGETKANQTVMGALTGGLLTPAATRAGEALARSPMVNRAAESIAGAFGRSPASSIGTNATISQQVDKAIKDAFSEIRQDPATLNVVQLDALRKSALDAMRRGKKLDLAAVMRSEDFKALGIPYTLGQVTRDPMQWANEQNLRGIAGAGEPITQRLMTQRRSLGDILRGFSQGATERADAGTQFISTLDALDEKMGDNVRALYKTARQSAQKDLDIPLTGFAQDVAQIVSDFGDKVPSGVMNKVRELGLMSGRQLRTFTLEDADKLSKVINANYSNDPATNAALDAFRRSLKQTVESAVPNADNPFFPAVRAAAERFALRDQVPALKAAALGGANEDTFVRQFVIQGRPTDVRNLADLLKRTDPDAFNQARQQVAAFIERAAFGQNPAGDKNIAAERLAAALDSLGTARLKAFFSPDEIDRLRKVSRVAAYIVSEPAGSAPNRSNSAAAMANVLTGMGSRIPGASTAVTATKALGNAVVTPVVQSRQVNRALSGTIPQTDAPLTAEQQRLLKLLITPGVIGASAALN